MPYDVEAIRKKIKESQSGKFNDPDEFKPGKATSDSIPLKYRFFFLPPLQVGDPIKSGIVKQGMEQFSIAHGNHWLDNKPYPCPRVWDNSECCVCSYGFDLLKEEKAKTDDKLRAKILSDWMPAAYNITNIYFPDTKDNPEELRGRVMFYNAPKTIIDICNNCLMRDDAGDEESPEAFGVFYDEYNAFKFEMQVLKNGRNNSYKTSKFLARPTPLLKDDDGKPFESGIAAILKMRHNLFAKIGAPDLDKLNKAFELFRDGGGDSNGGFDRDETSKPSSKQQDQEQRNQSKSSRKQDDDDEDERPVSKAKKQSKSEDDDERPTNKPKSS